MRLWNLTLRKRIPRSSSRRRSRYRNYDPILPAYWDYWWRSFGRYRIRWPPDSYHSDANTCRQSLRRSRESWYLAWWFSFHQSVRNQRVCLAYGKSFYPGSRRKTYGSLRSYSRLGYSHKSRFGHNSPSFVDRYPSCSTYHCSRLITDRLYIYQWNHLRCPYEKAYRRSIRPVCV